MKKKKKVVNDFERSTLDYFKDINGYSPLSKEEEQTLWERYKKHNDIAARDKIVKSNLKFVASVAKPYIGMGLSYSDLISEGNIGLMKAMDKFDYEKGFKTISYSVWWIKQTILEALNKRNSIKGDELPQYNESYNIDNEDSQSYINENDNYFYDEFIENDDFSDMKSSEEQKIISMLNTCLNDRERDIVSYYFGLNGKKEMTLEEIGNIFGLTKERIRQIKEGAFKKLRSEALKNSLNLNIYV